MSADASCVGNAGTSPCTVPPHEPDSCVWRLSHGTLPLWTARARTRRAQRQGGPDRGFRRLPGRDLPGRAAGRGAGAAHDLRRAAFNRTGSFFATASGGIGWGTPAAVGVALGDRDRGAERPVVGLIGDGSFQYSVQAIYTAAQHNLPIVYVVMRNHEYSILKSFAALEETPGVPGLDLPGLDVAAVARGFGCRAVDVETTEDLEREFKSALTAGTTTVIVVPTQPQTAML
ncbi:thiamine pyrophosphate-dependent enzyme [Streptomyces sp. NPDC085866]|uniref:thiamine pyrophosphate-dependent enzyme n=1 Tax=Streptomyces sp. NPDC085866 TaxID=3365736 RepID=UPI0037D5E3A9